MESAHLILHTASHPKRNKRDVGSIGLVEKKTAEMTVSSIKIHIF